MDNVARQARPHAGGDASMNVQGAEKVVNILCENFAPDAVDSIFQDAARFLQFEMTDQRTAATLAEFDKLRCGAESKIQMDGAAPGQFAPAPCVKKATLPGSEKSLILASVQVNLAFPVAAEQMRRLLGSSGGTAR